MIDTTQHGNMSKNLKHMLAHLSITLLAVGLAFSLPLAARYILYDWWPRVEEDSRMMVITEIAFAATLVVFFNAIETAWKNRRTRRLNSIVSLVHAKERDDWRSRLADRSLRKRVTSSRDVSALSVSGKELFGPNRIPMSRALEDCYEIRVMLLNPDHAESALRTMGTEAGAALLLRHRAEVKSTVAELARLRDSGKKVTLKFYDITPFWKLLISGDHVWVQYCADSPEYIFALQRDKPGRGFFAPFYVFFLDLWNDSRFPEYDFDSGQLRSGGDMVPLPALC